MAALLSRSGRASDSYSSLTVPASTGLAVGDGDILMVTGLHLDSAGTPTITVPSGFELVASDLVAGSGRSVFLGLWWRVAPDTSSITVSVDSGFTTWPGGWSVNRYGVSGIAWPGIVDAATATIPSGALTAPGVTVTAAASLVVTFAAGARALGTANGFTSPAESGTWTGSINATFSQTHREFMTAPGAVTMPEWLTGIGSRVGLTIAVASMPPTTGAWSVGMIQW